MMRAALLSLVVSSLVGAAWPAAGQAPVGALAIDERQGNRWGWAVDYETAAAARSAALEECGAGCSVVLTFGRCGAYAADQAGGSTAYGWGESYGSAEGARERAFAECGSRGGTSCAVRAWGCNGLVVEEGLGLDRPARREVQLGLRAVGFDPGGADGLFGPRTRAAIRSWQRSRGARATGYLDGASAEALRRAGASGAAVAQVARPEPAVTSEAPPSASPGDAAPPRASAELEGLFWQSIMNSTNPAEFKAYLAQFPNGVFSGLARARLAALQSPSGAVGAAAGPRVGGAATAAAGAQVPGASRTGATAAAPGIAAVNVPLRPGEVFRDCAECPEMVVLSGGRLALGALRGDGGGVSCVRDGDGGGAGGGCITVGGDSWRNPGLSADGPASSDVHELG